MTISMSFNDAVVSHYEGMIDVGSFCRELKSNLVSVAKKLMRRWSCPISVGMEDVLQELIIGCLRHIKKYDPTRLKVAPLPRFVLFNACADAKRWMHHQRGVSTSGQSKVAADRAKSVQSRSLDAIMDVSGPSRASPGNQKDIGGICHKSMSVEPTQHLECEIRECWRAAVDRAPSRRMKYAILALAAARGEPAKATNFLYRNVDVRLRLRIGSEFEAKRIVTKACDWIEGKSGLRRAA